MSFLWAFVIALEPHQKPREKDTLYWQVFSRVSNSGPSYYLKKMIVEWQIYYTNRLNCEMGVLLTETSYCPRIPAMRTGFSVIKTGIFLWELSYREFPASFTGFGFAVQREKRVRQLNLNKLLMNQPLNVRPVWISSYLQFGAISSSKNSWGPIRKEYSLRYDFNP